MKFEPTLESVSQHKIPAWYDDAKLGIFIHWSLFSVPAYASIDGRDIMSMNKEGGMSYMMQRNPYAEWYLNTLRIEGSPTKAYHEQKYGKDFSYFSFQKEFEERSQKADFNEWAKFFAECGAKYSVLVTKHHDGYCLWPSKYKNPFDSAYQCPRDLVGQWSQAIRSQGMKVGLYYSGILDWTFKEYPLDGEKGFLKHSIASRQYAKYATNHIYELIERYQPSILWNDIGYPGGVNLNQIFADYYNAIPEGVVNNRWSQTELPEDLSEEELDRIVEKQGGLTPEMNLFGSRTHYDFATPEYMAVDAIQEKKFESTRGVGLSFGFNQNETEKEMLSSEELIHMFVDIVSKNGNLLIDVGPTADGVIPEMQRKPLRALGQWLHLNGEAIFGTRPWERPSSKTQKGQEVRYTSRGDALYATILDSHVDREVVIRDLHIPDSARINLLGFAGEVSHTTDAGNLKLVLPKEDKGQLAYTLRIV